MPTYRIVTNSLCDENEKSESLLAAKIHLLAFLPDVRWFLMQENELLVQTDAGSLHDVKMRGFFLFREIFPWLDVQEREAETYEPSAVRGKVTGFVSEHHFNVIDWVNERVFDRNRQQYDENFNVDNGMANCFLFPESVRITFEQGEILIVPNEGLDDIEIVDAADLCRHAALYGRSGDAWVRLSEIPEAAFAFDNGRNPWRLLCQGTIRGNGRLPERMPQRARNSMHVWYDAARRHARTPETVFFPVPCNFNDLLDGKRPPCFRSYCNALKAYARGRSLPFFLRSDQTSNKHDFENTCRLDDIDVVGRHVANIIEFSGCVDLPYESFALREWIHGSSVWNEELFSNMPVRREFRFFVENGTVTHVQPYWPEEAFESSPTLPENWRELLASLAVLSREDYQYLSACSQKIASELGGNWSVDWLCSDDGWVLTDMAVAEQSYRYQPEEAWVRKYDWSAAM